ncbi:MAG: General secretory pathway protein E [Microgenomates group bacterium GW2011_GWA1_Microgenomates_45_10]|nr:MAG: General secretory pathway protein E [Microgenomates group bacterium GW2011_GWA2_44_7]KKT87488.1 MAG: General secretory pathway protein E [Microgenomates group bacterium GW2011_GWA1_Microgenomates_45_10]
MPAPFDKTILLGPDRFKKQKRDDNGDEIPLPVPVPVLPAEDLLDQPVEIVEGPSVPTPPSSIPAVAPKEPFANLDITVPDIEIGNEVDKQPIRPSNFISQLVSMNALSEELAQKIQLESATTGRSIDDIITEKKLVDQETITKAKAAFFNVPFIKLSEIGISPEALAAIPKALAERYKLIPFDIKKDKRELSVAMANPLDLPAIEFLEKKVGMRVRPYTAVPIEVIDAIANNYAQNLSAEVTAALRETTPQETKTIDIKQLGEVIREAPIAKIVSTILEYAIKSRASDVHIEPQTDRVRVRYRIDGILHERLILPKNVHEALVSRIKILAGMKIDEKRLPQDGRFNFRAAGEEVDLRVSSLPTVLGEKIVMRLLKKSGGVPTLSDLGIRGKALKNLEDAILRPHGIILICGPTGSGKTTTLYAILSKINTTRVNIVTLEDPVEYQIFGVNQVQVNPTAGLNFASGLRSFLRQDPNIIMVGEIRDTETSDLAIQASLTGHLVFSTLHTNDASGALPRLLDFGMEPFLLASSMTAIVAQRVVRKICTSCKTEYDPPDEVIENAHKVLGSLYPSGKSFKLMRGTGCAECSDSGYQGRVGIFEVIPVTEGVGKLILERASAGGIQGKAVEEGLVTMKQDGYLKVIEGITTIEEVLRVAQE